MSINNSFCGDYLDAKKHLDIRRKAIKDDEIFQDSEFFDILDKAERFEFYKESNMCSVFMIKNKQPEVV
jgi:hypothetical protein